MQMNLFRAENDEGVREDSCEQHTGRWTINSFQAISAGGNGGQAVSCFRRLSKEALAHAHPSGGVF